MAHDVFISHSSKDKPVADAVTAALEAGRIRCWVAPRDIPSGQKWGEAIIDGINQCRVMVLIFSAHANVSPHIEREVEREVERAVSKGLYLIPFRLDPAPLTKQMEYLISTPHRLDAMTGPLERHLSVLVRTVAAILSAQADRPAPAAGPGPPVAAASGGGGHGRGVPAPPADSPSPTAAPAPRGATVDARTRAVLGALRDKLKRYLDHLTCSEVCPEGAAWLSQEMTSQGALLSAVERQLGECGGGPVAVADDDAAARAGLEVMRDKLKRDLAGLAEAAVFPEAAEYVSRECKAASALLSTVEGQLAAPGRA